MMIFKQLTYAPSGCASYFLACPAAGEAVVVDPLDSLGAEEYLMEAAERGVVIRYVVDTHIHADHTSAGRTLAQMAGADYVLNERVRGLARFDFVGVNDGDHLCVGRLSLQVMETPGHTPESLCLLVSDRARSDDPWFVMTGDTLFVGDVGRPDLVVGDPRVDVYAQEERARLLYRSVHERLMTLPEHVEIYPGHFGGSACGGANMSGKAVSTIAYEKRWNLPLQQPTPEEFAEMIRRTTPPHPPNYRHIKRENLGWAKDDEIAGA